MRAKIGTPGARLEREHRFSQDEQVEPGHHHPVRIAPSRRPAVISAPAHCPTVLANHRSAHTEASKGYLLEMEEATQPTQAATQAATQVDSGTDEADVWGFLLPCNSLNPNAPRVKLHYSKLQYTVGRSPTNDVVFMRGVTISTPLSDDVFQMFANRISRFKTLHDRVGRRCYFLFCGKGHRLFYERDLGETIQVPSPGSSRWLTV